MRYKIKYYKNANNNNKKFANKITRIKIRGFPTCRGNARR